MLANFDIVRPHIWAIVLSVTTQRAVTHKLPRTALPLLHTLYICYDKTESNCGSTAYIYQVQVLLFQQSRSMCSIDKQVCTMTRCNPTTKCMIRAVARLHLHTIPYTRAQGSASPEKCARFFGSSSRICCRYRTSAEAAHRGNRWRR